MTAYFKIAGAMTAALTFAACATVQEAPPEPKQEVVVVPQPVQTCIPKSSLTKVVIPAEYKEGFATTSINVPSDFITDPDTGEVREIKYPPIENRQPYKTLIKPEQIFYVDDENREITDLCEDEDVTDSNAIPDS